MRNAVASILILAFAAGCGGPGNAPAAVKPTLTAIEALSFHCGPGVEDNVPSGLVQWSCGDGTDPARSSVLVDGNDEGVAGITLVTTEPGDPETARASFGRLVDAVPPLSRAPILKDTIADWTGRQQAWVVGGVRLFASCDATQCIVMVMPSGNALRPLPLP